jgi:hypothetical protein
MVEPARERPKRGIVRGFSEKSRSRMLRLVSSVPRARDGEAFLFTTLTYPASYPVEWERWKANLKAWWLRVRRHYPGAAAIWKLEPQKRGAPHFHLMIVGLVETAADELGQWWYEVVSSGDPWHRKFGTLTVKADTYRGVAAYVAKYAGKTVDLRKMPEWAKGVGRWWGVLSRANLRVEVVTYPLPDHAWQAARAHCKALLAERTKGRKRRSHGNPWETELTGLWLILPDDEAMALIDAVTGGGGILDPPESLLLVN